MAGFPVRLDGPSQVALFAYDNDTFIVESYLPGARLLKFGTRDGGQLRDLVSGELLQPLPDKKKESLWEPPVEKRTSFEVPIGAHSFPRIQDRALARTFPTAACGRNQRWHGSPDP